MSSANPLAVVAMSGGVDSSVAAAELRDAGYRVLGVSLRLWDSARRDDRICSDSRDARRVADHLGIEHVELDRRAEFEATVVGPFVSAYAGGATPNPCVACNGRFKLGALVDWALAQGADAVATGHYARVRREGPRMRLLRGADEARDQSYFLFEVAARALERTLFPVGDLTKDEVRTRARARRLPVSEKPDSQDLCFGSPAALVAARGRSRGPGSVVDEDGRRLGTHAGIEHFTVGQRRGLGIPAPSPMYVRALESDRREVVVGRFPESLGLLARDWTWLSEPAPPDEPLIARIRARDPGRRATVEPAPANRWRVWFGAAAPAVTPGQAVVVYRGDEVAGGGWIEQSLGDGLTS